MDLIVSLRLVVDRCWPDEARTVRPFAKAVRHAVSRVGGAFTLAFVTVDPLSVESALAVACEAAGLTGSPRIELTRAAARVRLESLLARDLAYNSERVAQPRCSQLAEAFLAFFSPHARLFTNGRDRTSWWPLTRATFDGGIVAIDTHRAGVLWVEDED